MGKVCFSHDTLLITDNDSTTQDDKSPLACNCKPGWVSSFQRQPTPSLAIARWGGFLSSFFSSQRTPTTMTSHVGSSLSSASIVDPQRVIMTCGGLSLPLHLQRQPQRPPTSHYDLLGALSPPPPATPATTTPNESLRLRGSLSPSTCNA